MFRGPEHSLIGSIFMIIFGILIAIAAFRRETRLGKAPGAPVSTAGRFILFTMALVLTIFGLRDLVR
jgi:hypothetical protein